MKPIHMVDLKQQRRLEQRGTSFGILLWKRWGLGAVWDVNPFGDALVSCLSQPSQLKPFSKCAELGTPGCKCRKVCGKNIELLG